MSRAQPVTGNGSLKSEGEGKVKGSDEEDGEEESFSFLVPFLGISSLFFFLSNIKGEKYLRDTVCSGAYDFCYYIEGGRGAWKLSMCTQSYVHTV